jgi:DNA ligase-associated metallophosphoesterase
MNQIEVIFGEEVLIAQADKTLFWPKENTLFIADLHYGKMAHFRANGLAVPEIGVKSTIEIIQKALLTTGAKKLVVLGDFFHSVANTILFELEQYWQMGDGIEQWLVPGNHDIIDEAWFTKLGFIIVPQGTALGPFILVHEPPEKPKSNNHYLCGHIHPGIVIKGKARQSLRLPCFYFGGSIAILPAFGAFTGLAQINYNPKIDTVIAVSEGEVFRV